MTSNFIPIIGLALVAVTTSTILRRLTARLRVIVELAVFLALSFYLKTISTFPIFPALSGKSEAGALLLRAVGGVWWLLGARITVDFLWFAFHRDQRSREARLRFDLSAAAIYVATVVVVLNSVFSVPVTGVVATSGVVAIVIGLALQSTLADVFAGIAVGIEAPFGVGHRIQLGDRVEGQVVQINWRSIRIQTDGNDVAIIPNSVVAKAEITNRSFPSQQRVASVELTCPIGASPERVIELLLQATILCPDILRAPEPRASLVTLERKRNVYRIKFHVADTKALSPTRDLLLRSSRRQLHYAGLLDEKGCQRAFASQFAEDSVLPRRLLRDIILFECLADDQIESLARHLTVQWIEPNETLFVEGGEDASLFIVGSGVVEVSRRIDGAREVLGCIGAGEYLGEIGLLTGVAHAASATARTDCLTYRLDRDRLAPLLAESAELAASFDKSVRKGLKILHRDVAVLATPGIGPPGQLLARIRDFLHFG